MKSEKRICQNCKRELIIEPEDFEFYQKIKVPAPTFAQSVARREGLLFAMKGLYIKENAICAAKLWFPEFHRTNPIQCTARNAGGRINGIH